MCHHGRVQAVRTARERARAELTREITAEARRQLAAEGAAVLSLRSVARALGMASSAIYRYFPSRDDLLTALIVEAYDALGDRAERTNARWAADDIGGRWRAVCSTIRRWALANPHEYALVYGSPVPGYRAPQLTVGPASRVTAVLAGILSDAHAAGVLSPMPSGRPLRTDWTAEAAPVAQLAMPGVPSEAVLRGLMAWVEIFGLISFELFGHLVGVVDHPALLFEEAVGRIGELVGLPPPAR